MTSATDGRESSITSTTCPAVKPSWCCSLMPYTQVHEVLHTLQLQRILLRRSRRCGSHKNRPKRGRHTQTARRHSSIFVRTVPGSLIPSASRAGVSDYPGWAHTHLVYTSGTLQARTAGICERVVGSCRRQPGRPESFGEFVPPESISLDRGQNAPQRHAPRRRSRRDSHCPPTHPATPSDGRITPLFDDSREEERKYLAQTGMSRIIPSMHQARRHRTVSMGAGIAVRGVQPGTRQQCHPPDGRRGDPLSCAVVPLVGTRGMGTRGGE